MGSIEAFKIGYFVLGEKAKRSISCNTKTPNKIKMRKKGFEPSRPNGHMRLKHARLPFRHFRSVSIIPHWQRFSSFFCTKKQNTCFFDIMNLLRLKEFI